MLRVDHIQVQGFEPAIRGMRNPMNSWGKSDSEFYHSGIIKNIGDGDLKLMQNLFSAGSEHRKFDRMLVVWMDITAPLYWWKEFDTYKVGTVANSCSTMHRIHSKEFTMDDFSVEHLDDNSLHHMTVLIEWLNYNRELFRKTGDKSYWWQMIQLLPSSYNQRRTVMMNYEVCARIVDQRTGHKLDEWSQLITHLRRLPYFREVCDGGQEDD